MKSSGLNKLNIILLSVVALIIMACGGFGSDSSSSGPNALDKHISVHFNNNAITSLVFKDPAGGQTVVPSGGQGTTTLELVLTTTSSTHSWTFYVNSTTGSNITSGTYTWDYATANGNTGLDVNIDSNHDLTFSPEP